MKSWNLKPISKIQGKLFAFKRKDKPNIEYQQKEHRLKNINENDKLKDKKQPIIKKISLSNAIKKSKESSHKKKILVKVNSMNLNFHVLDKKIKFK